jgi:hypothetical protein
VALTAGDGTDTVSGVNTGSRIVQRRTATLTGSSCGSYGSWGAITPTGTYPNLTDTTVTTAHCYQYQYLVSDAAGNQATTTSTNDAKVDTVAPTATQTTAIASVTSSNTPSYVFSSTEAGTITYSGGCTSVTTSAVSGSNTVVFSALARGASYGSCTIRVTDVASNQSSVLNVPTFAVTYRGDLNTDRSVDTLDFGVLHTNFGSTTPGNVADINEDNVVNVLDFGIMHGEFNNSF